MKDIDTLLKEVKKIHMIGIGGSGMCPIAEILHKEGYELTGSDNNESDPLQRVRNMGVDVKMGHSPDNIGDAEMVIHTAALLKDNVELLAARERGIPTFERSEILGAISRLYGNCIGVCGTHGKTTTSSMLTQVLLTAGMDPSAVIGGKLPLIDSYGRVGHSDTFVCEACEFVDTFLKLSPRTAILLNIDDDHLDYFKTMDNLKKSFTKFCSMADVVIYNGDDKNTLDAISNVCGDKKYITFGRNESNDYCAKNVVMKSGKATFDVYKYGEYVVSLHLVAPGEHNVYNALATFSAADNEGASVEDIKKGIETFYGAGRRFEKLGEYKGVTIFDDYAHHPTELRATLNSAMQMGYNTVWAVFQPFTFSRTKMLFDDFVDVLKIPDKCVMSEIMGSREVNTFGIYTADLAKEIPGSVWFKTFGEIADYVAENAKPGDMVITLGCGDIYKAARMIVDRLK